MRIRRQHMPTLMAAGIIAGIGLALLLALFVGVGVTRAGFWAPEHCNLPFTQENACSGDLTCWGDSVEERFGCSTVAVTVAEGCCNGAAVGSVGDVHTAAAVPDCVPIFWCLVKVPTGGSAWLADVCEPNDGFSADGGMTWDSNYPGPLQFAASMEGPWYEVQVNGPPWTVTEENMESFAAMVGVEDWHDMWVRSGDGYPRHVGNTVMERDARMDVLCAE